MPQSIEQIRTQYEAHLSTMHSVILGTVDEHGQPLSSYAPVVLDPLKNMYIMVSGISPHTRNLEQSGVVSAMLIEDEHQCQEIFARRRLTFDCTVSHIDPDSAIFDSIADSMYARHGTIIERMRLLPDFRILRLAPQKGRFVIGFGAAYVISGDNLDTITHLGGTGKNPHGHGSNSKNPHHKPQK